MLDQTERGKGALVLRGHIAGAREVDGSMRKYQQLALALITLVSLVAFLFYKHEYERLRYTLEYLDTFGQPPAEEEGDRPACGYSTQHWTSTPPTDWVQVSPDLQVYSAFWDDQSGLGEPWVRALGVALRTTQAPTTITALLWFEGKKVQVGGSCSVEASPSRSHSASTKEQEVHLLHLLCSADDKKLMLQATPYLVQFKVGSGPPSTPVAIQHSQSLKTVVNRSTLCLLPPKAPATSLQLVEYLAYHNILGFDKFVMYGASLTPLARSLLDRYGDEVGLHYEEKLFSPAPAFSLGSEMVRAVVELDCLYRHQDSQENVLVLGLDQFLVLQHKLTLQDTLQTLVRSSGRTRPREVAQFHLSRQQVCVDQQHLRQGTTLLLAQQVHTVGQLGEAGEAVLRPHLYISTLGAVGQESPSSQHVSPATALVHHYTPCSPNDQHSDTHHLPTNARFLNKVNNSLLYRKWVINN